MAMKNDYTECETDREDPELLLSPTLVNLHINFPQLPELVRRLVELTLEFVNAVGAHGQFG